jgi:hypothetical protein
MDFNNFQYHKSKIPSDSSDQALYFDELQKKFYESIKQNKEHQTYFSHFDPQNIDYFLLRYSKQRIELIKHYEWYTEELYHNKDLRYREESEEIFSYIQQKKLINLQAEWHAEKIKIKEIQIEAEFSFWERHLDQCPFLPPVKAIEVEAMKAYLKEQNDDECLFGTYMGGESRSLLMTRYHLDFPEDIPEWFKFYDNYMGTASLFSLPNIRGEKEEFYIDIWRNHWEEEYKKQRKDNPITYSPPPPSLPYLHGSAENIYEYAIRFETDPYIKELFRLYFERMKFYSTHNTRENEMIEKAIDILAEAPNAIHVSGPQEWRTGIINCAKNYKNSIIADDLDVIFEEYQMLASLGIKKSELIENYREEYAKDDIIQNYYNNILTGRELNGEPRDFNF